MKTTEMETPRNRREFERNFHLLREHLHKGKMHFSANVSYTIKSILNVRLLPNKRLDLLSIDESARLQANMMANMIKIPVPPNIDETIEEDVMK